MKTKYSWEQLPTPRTQMGNSSRRSLRRSHLGGKRPALDTSIAAAYRIREEPEKGAKTPLCKTLFALCRRYYC